MRHRPGAGLTHPAASLFARDYGQGLMSRREFLTRATALGVGAGAATETACTTGVGVGLALMAKPEGCWAWALATAPSAAHAPSEARAKLRRRVKGNENGAIVCMIAQANTMALDSKPCSLSMLLTPLPSSAL